MENLDLGGIFFPSFVNGFQSIPLESCFFEKDNPSEEFHDLIFFKVQSSWLNHDSEFPSFFPITRFKDGERHLSFAIGHATSSDVLDYDEEEIKFKTSILSCNLDVNYTSNNRFFRCFSYDAEYGSLDGFSGGAVFSLIGDTENLEITFDGIIIRGGNGRIYVVDSDFIWKSFEKFL